MEPVTLNLLSELGITAPRRLKKAPALTLHPDGTMTV